MPVAQNTTFTQYHEKKDELYKFFWKVADQAPWKRHQGDTTQGWYTFNAAGELYDWQNDRDNDVLLEMLKSSRSRFAKRPPKKLQLPKEESPSQPHPPRGAAVLRVFTRIRPLPNGADEMNRHVGRDHLWILEEEVAEILDGRFPDGLGARLSLFHLWDNVRGEPDPWASEDVQRADFRSERTPSGARISGAFRLVAPPFRANNEDIPERGFEGTLEGELVVNARKKVASFRIYVEGTAWGRCTYTPDPPPGKFPLKIAMVLCDDAAAREIAPHGVGWGTLEEYLRPSRR